MVKHKKLQRSVTNSTDRSSVCSAGYMESTYCVILHVVEAINFYGREVREGEQDKIIMNAALNTVDFEVEGTSSTTSETIVFNSNCIWECDMAGIKRIKTDHRPVKVTFFSCSGGMERKTIGSLLLPVRGLPVLGSGGNNSPLQLKMFWHKLMCISNEFRSHKPEVLLMLAIIKKSLLHTNDFKHLMAFNGAEKQSRTPPLKSPGHSITANMLQSQANVYVQSLVQLGLLQVGNDPLVDCDIVEVVLQLRQLRNVNNFIKSIFHGKDVETVLLMFDFVGNITSIELKLDSGDNYTLNDVLGLRFKSSLRSIHLYFQRIFYLPINMYVNGGSIANYRMDFGKLMPPDSYFEDRRQYKCSGSFAFERFGRNGSARELKPILDYGFSVDIQEVCCRQQGRGCEQGLQVQQRQKQMDMNSVASCAVIHEVPKDRTNEGVVDWKRNQEEQCPSDNASVGSLDVGAELSASDEPDSTSELHTDFLHDSETPSAAVCGSKGHRKKFTRLLENDCGREEHMEFSDENKHYSVARQHYEKAKCIPQQQLSDNVDFPEDIESDAEILSIYNNRKFIGKFPHDGSENSPKFFGDNLRRSDDKSDEIVSLTQANNLLTFKAEERAIRSTRKQKLKAMESQISPNNDSADNQAKLHEEQPLRHLQDALLDEEQIPRKISKKKIKQSSPSHNLENEPVKNTLKNSSSEIQQIIENMSQELAKDKRNKRVVKVHPSASIEEMSLSKSCPSENDVKNTISKQSSLYDSLEKQDATKTLNCKQILVRKKSSVPRTEVEFIEGTELTKSLSKSRVSEHNRYLVSEKSTNETEKSDKCVQQEHPCPSPTKIILRSKERNVKNISDDFIGERDISFPKPNSQKNLINSEESEVSERAIGKKPPKSKRPSNSDITLSARWVEVNKAHKKALVETDRYISEMCKAEIDLALSEDQYSDVRVASNMKKLVVSSRKIQRKHVEHVDESSEIASSVDDAQLDKFGKPKIERKMFKKKSTITDSRQDHAATEMTDGKVLKSKVKKSKETIQLQVDYIESEKDSFNRGSNHYATTCKKTEVISFEESFDLDEKHQETGGKPMRKKSIKLSSPDQVESKLIRKKLAKTVPTKVSQEKLPPALDYETKKDNYLQESKPDGQISNMEVTVHMYGQSQSISGETRKPKAKFCDQGVNTNTDDNNGIDSFRQIVEANEQLQEEIQILQSLYNMNQLGDHSVKDQSCTDVDYQSKFCELEQHISQLENYLHDFESRTHKMQAQNAKLVQEKIHLKERIRHMEKQMSQHNQDTKSNELQQLLSEMRLQNSRFLDMSKAKDRYKKQWRRCAKRVHSLKLTMYEKNLQHEYDSMPDNVINLKRILTKDADEFEREYGQFRRRDTTLNFAESEQTCEPQLKDYLRGLSVQTIKKHSPQNSFESTRMH